MDCFNPLAVTAPTPARTTDRHGRGAADYSGRTAREPLFGHEVRSDGMGQRPVRIWLIAPGGQSGNYFADQSRSASRFSGRLRYTFAPVDGGRRAPVQDRRLLRRAVRAGRFAGRPINMVDNNQRLLTRIAFPRTSNFEIRTSRSPFSGRTTGSSRSGWQSISASGPRHNRFRAPFAWLPRAGISMDAVPEHGYRDPRRLRSLLRSRAL